MHTDLESQRGRVIEELSNSEHSLFRQDPSFSITFIWQIHEFKDLKEYADLICPFLGHSNHIGWLRRSTLLQYTDAVSNLFTKNVRLLNYSTNKQLTPWPFHLQTVSRIQRKLHAWQPKYEPCSLLMYPGALVHRKLSKHRHTPQTKQRQQLRLFVENLKYNNH